MRSLLSLESDAAFVFPSSLGVFDTASTSSSILHGLQMVFNKLSRCLLSVLIVPNSVGVPLYMSLVRFLDILETEGEVSTSNGVISQTNQRG